MDQIKKNICFSNYQTTDTILFIGGTHGDERSGSMALLDYNFNNSDKNIINIPKVNPYGFRKNIRYEFNGIDLNRCYGLKDYQYLDDKIKNTIQFIEKQVFKADYIFDFHEAKGFRVLDNKSVGNTIITENNSEIANSIVKKINKKLPKDKQFILHSNKKSISSSLRNFCIQNGKKYCLIEISKNQNISERIKICKNIIDICMDII